MNLEERRVLQMIADGVVSAAEGERLMESMKLVDDISLESPPVKADGVAFPPPPAWSEQWLGIVLIGTVLMFGGLGATFLVVGRVLSGWWLLLTLPVLLVGLLVILLGYFCSSQRWLHIHVDSDDAKFKFGLPLPFSWLVAVFKMARLFEPKLAVITDDVLDELTYAAEGYFYVEVDEADKNEYVQVYYA